MCLKYSVIINHSWPLHFQLRARKPTHLFPFPLLPFPPPLPSLVPALLLLRRLCADPGVLLLSLLLEAALVFTPLPLLLRAEVLLLRARGLLRRPLALLGVRTIVAVVVPVAMRTGEYGYFIFS